MSKANGAGRLQGKTAVITGGTSGIGLETARQYVTHGARVLITGRNRDRLDQACAQLGGDVVGVVADSTALADLDRLAAEAAAKFGRVDILFANAGGGFFAPIAEVGEEDYTSQFDLNVKSVFFTIQKILPLMQRDSAIILNSSAVHGKGAPGASLYFASKAAVRSLARTLSAELAGQGIRVNALSPGIVPTQFFANSNMGEGAYGQFETMVEKSAPLARAGTAQEIALAAVYLGSDESSYITAIDLSVDGGWSQV